MVSPQGDLPVVRATRRALARPGTTLEAAYRALDIVGDSLGWLVGTLWMVDDTDRCLRPVVTWRARVFTRADFEESSLGMTLEPGIGLPGRVWEADEPLWMEDVLQDANFRRHTDAHAAGLRGALAFPIRDGGRIVGVAEFFTDTLHAPVATLRHAFRIIGDEIGARMQRDAGLEPAGGPGG